MMMRKKIDHTTLDKRKERPKLKEDQDWLEFMQEELLMLRKQSTLIISQFTSHSLYPILMIMLPYNKMMIV
jgi:hypothetical protein